MDLVCIVSPLRNSNSRQSESYPHQLITIRLIYRIPVAARPYYTMHLANENSSDSSTMDQFQNSILSIARCSVISYRAHFPLCSFFFLKSSSNQSAHVPWPTINYDPRQNVGVVLAMNVNTSNRSVVEFSIFREYFCKRTILTV